MRLISGSSVYVRENGGNSQQDTDEDMSELVALATHNIAEHALRLCLEQCLREQTVSVVVTQKILCNTQARSYRENS